MIENFNPEYLFLTDEICRNSTITIGATEKRYIDDIPHEVWDTDPFLIKKEYNMKYLVTTNGFYSGTYELTVKKSAFHDGNKFRYVSGHPFGCSKDYYVDSDDKAINLLVKEHGCSVVDIVEHNEQSVV